MLVNKLIVTLIEIGKMFDYKQRETTNEYRDGWDRIWGETVTIKSNFQQFFIQTIDKKIAKDIIITNHYTHKWTSCRYALGLFNNNKLVGVAIYGFPVGRRTVKSISSILENSDVLELTRLWINDSEGYNTESWFIGQTFKWLKNNTKIKVLISYSDPNQHHLGIIYQATNWLYQGNKTQLVNSVKVYINGESLHPRTCVSKYGTINLVKLKKIDFNCFYIQMLQKHRYIYILSKRNKRIILQTLKHPILNYPKGENYVARRS